VAWKGPVREHSHGGVWDQECRTVSERPGEAPRENTCRVVWGRRVSEQLHGGVWVDQFKTLAGWCGSWRENTRTVVSGGREHQNTCRVVWGEVNSSRTLARWCWGWRVTEHLQGGVWGESGRTLARWCRS